MCISLAGTEQGALDKERRQRDVTLLWACMEVSMYVLLGPDAQRSARSTLIRCVLYHIVAKGVNLVLTFGCLQGKADEVKELLDYGANVEV